MSKDNIVGFPVWSDHEEKELGTKDNRNIVDTSILAMPVVGVRDNHSHPGSSLCVRKQRVPQHRESPTLRQRQVMDDLMTDGGGGGIKTLAQKFIPIGHKTAKWPTPPRRRERLHRRETPPNSC